MRRDGVSLSKRRETQYSLYKLSLRPLVFQCGPSNFNSDFYLQPNYLVLWSVFCLNDLPTMSRSLTEEIHSNTSHGICQEVWRPNPWDYSNVLHKVCIVRTMHFSQCCKRKWRNAISSKMCMYIFHWNFNSPVLIHLLNLNSFIHTYVST